MDKQVYRYITVRRQPANKLSHASRLYMAMRQMSAAVDVGSLTVKNDVLPRPTKRQGRAKQNKYGSNSGNRSFRLDRIRTIQHFGLPTTSPTRWGRTLDRQTFVNILWIY